MRILKISLCILFTNVSLLLLSQTYPLNFIYPIDRTPNITGNYGEIRPNHFHVGLDFSTDAILNLPIKSVADGYVSRIKISSAGYGKVLYVTHANGYVSVYAHQKKYADKIDAYVKGQQRQQQKNELELFPTSTELPVKKGEVIGYTGNSGSSTGPHLHFEIREEKSEIPINPLLVYDVKDNVKPTVTGIAIYNSQDTNIISLQKIYSINNKLAGIKNKLILPQNTFAIGFSGYDVATLGGNKNNIYEVNINFDNTRIYHHQLNHISFDNARYVNVFSEKTSGQKIQKCFVPTCNTIDIYKTLINGGKIELKDTLWHTIELTAADEKGNESVVTFQVKSTQLKGYVANNSINNVACNKDFNLKDNLFEITIPHGSVTNHMFINKRTYIKAPIGGDIELGNKNDKVIKPIKIGLKINNLIKQKESKLVMTVNGDVIGGKYEQGWLRAESKAFGAFNYKYDTVAPMITLPKSKNKKTTNSIHFKISDNCSGIADYNVFVNNNWQIAEYDAKSETVSCYFTENPKVNNSIRIEVTDKVGNKSIVNY